MTILGCKGEKVRQTVILQIKRFDLAQKTMLYGMIPCRCQIATEHVDITSHKVIKRNVI